MKKNWLKKVLDVNDYEKVLILNDAISKKFFEIF